MNTQLNFPTDPQHGDIFELKSGLLYQFDSQVNSWVKVVSSSINLPIATTINKGAMTAEDLKKLNRLVLPPPQSSIIGTDCTTPFQNGMIQLSSGDNFVGVHGNVNIQNIDEFGDIISEEHPFHIHQHTYGFDFTLDMPQLVQELISRKQIVIEGTTGDKGETGDQGDPGINKVIAGPQGIKGEQGLAPDCQLTIDPEPMSAEVRRDLKRALVNARIVDHPDKTKYIIEFDRQVVGAKDAFASQFNIKGLDSAWVLAISDITGAPQKVYYINLLPIIETIRQKFLNEIDRLKVGYEDIVEFWIQTMSDLFDEQKAALCCALEHCMSVRKSVDLRQHMEIVAASAIGAEGAKIALHGRHSCDAETISHTRLLGRMPNGEDLCEGGPQFPGGLNDCGGNLAVDDENADSVSCDAGMDVVFVLDTTGSMSNFIDEMKILVEDFVSTIESNSNNNYQLGLIAYTDSVAELVPFSSNNKDAFTAVLVTLDTTTGREIEEAMQTAVEQSLAYPWRNGKAKLVIVIADEPAREGLTACVMTGNNAKLQNIRISTIQGPPGTSAEIAEETTRHLRAFSENSGGISISTDSNVVNAINEILKICDSSLLQSNRCVTTCGVPTSVTFVVSGLTGPYAGGTDCIDCSKLNDRYTFDLTPTASNECRLTFDGTSRYKNLMPCLAKDFQIPGDDFYATTEVKIVGTLDFNSISERFTISIHYFVDFIGNIEAPSASQRIAEGIIIGSGVDISNNCNVQWSQSMSTWFVLDAENKWSCNDVSAFMAATVNFDAAPPLATSLSTTSLSATHNIHRTQTVIIDPLLNTTTIKSAVPIELSKGQYVATIKNMDVGIAGKYGAIIKMQHIENGKKKMIQFLNKGRFNTLSDSKNAYEGLSLSFNHDGGNIYIYFLTMPTSNVSGTSEIAIETINTKIDDIGIQATPQKTTIQTESDRRTHSISISNLITYQNDWNKNKHGAVVSVSGQDYIIIKTTNEVFGNVSLAWPTFDKQTFVPFPQNVESIKFHYDEDIHNVALQQIKKHNQSIILFPVS